MSMCVCFAFEKSTGIHFNFRHDCRLIWLYRAFFHVFFCVPLMMLFLRFFLCLRWNFQILTHFKFASHFPILQRNLKQFLIVYCSSDVSQHIHPRHGVRKWDWHERYLLIWTESRKWKFQVHSPIWMCYTLILTCDMTVLVSITYQETVVWIQHIKWIHSSAQFARRANELKRKWVRNNQHRLKGVHKTCYVLRLFFAFVLLWRTWKSVNQSATFK